MLCLDSSPFTYHFRRGLLRRSLLTRHRLARRLVGEGGRLAQWQSGWFTPSFESVFAIFVLALVIDAQSRFHR